jgi:hypothetical protein
MLTHMSRLHMMAGAVATGADAATEHISAYVVLADGAKSRLFKVGGTTEAPHIEELTAATTLDLKRFQEQLKMDLEGLGPLRPADATSACEIVRLHLRADLGV